ncbi:MAG: methyltransferase [Deltaproteobacteria bacterium]|nr:methyltransferase [Deltaproteobacteria bacterium]
MHAGHRWNTDDLLLAWAASTLRPGALSVLDLGCGVGSVGLLCLLRLPNTARLVGVEVQKVSAELAQRSLHYNGLEARARVCCADLRDFEANQAPSLFELITANPPYIAFGAGKVSPHPQRAAARLELHGDVFDYCRVARRHLAKGGRFVLCHSASDGRPEEAIQSAELALLSRQDVIFRRGKAPTIALFTCGHEGTREDAEDFVIRDVLGQRTEAFRALRRQMFMKG